MIYELPKNIKMSKKEEQKIDTLARGMAENFLKGVFFFITVPISIYKRIKRKNGGNS